ncbi:DUF4835 family protein [Paraflavitalea pollutisoli]|uniref:type IX secretion system protein PorD n=1 Tax=Paraflavitalea pollutisoli TaxID=3034143 RepID=UPI0023ECCD90|nr:DUF4835 family protein [Paraflavitalea sp. H1-2-19X]
MLNKICSLILFLAGLQTGVMAQELQARISINASQISSQTDRKIFQTLQNSLNTFLNNRKWTNETFQTNEKIVCHFLVVIRAAANNVYQASLTVQAARPVYNTNYETPLINFQDESFNFKYLEYQPVEFNENRVSGSDPLASNLTATLAYYVYVILGLDFDSFSLRGGDPYFQKAMSIVNNAPENRDISGWKAFDGLRNRYWLMENLTNNRYTLVHDAIYSYYRLGMDAMYENEAEGRNAVLNTLNIMNTLNTDISNTMVVPFFFQGKANELVRLFKKASPEERQKAREILMRVDITNANTYKQELK